MVTKDLNIRVRVEGMERLAKAGERVKESLSSIANSVDSAQDALTKASKGSLTFGTSLENISSKVLGLNSISQAARNLEKDVSSAASRLKRIKVDLVDDSKLQSSRESINGVIKSINQVSKSGEPLKRLRNDFKELSSSIKNLKTTANSGGLSFKPFDSSPIKQATKSVKELNMELKNSGSDAKFFNTSEIIRAQRALEKFIDTQRKAKESKLNVDVKVDNFDGKFFDSKQIIRAQQDVEKIVQNIQKSKEKAFESTENVFFSPKEILRAQQAVDKFVLSQEQARQKQKDADEQKIRAQEEIQRKQNEEAARLKKNAEIAKQVADAYKEISSAAAAAGGSGGVPPINNRRPPTGGNFGGGSSSGFGGGFLPDPGDIDIDTEIARAKEFAQQFNQELKITTGSANEFADRVTRAYQEARSQILATKAALEALQRVNDFDAEDALPEKFFIDRRRVLDQQLNQIQNQFGFATGNTSSVAVQVEQIKSSISSLNAELAEYRALTIQAGETAESFKDKSKAAYDAIIQKVNELSSKIRSITSIRENGQPVSPEAIRSLNSLQSALNNISTQANTKLSKPIRESSNALFDLSNVAKVAAGNIIAITSTEIVFGFRRLVGNIINTASSLQDLRNKINLVVEGNDELNEVQSNLFRISETTRSSFAATTELYTRLARSTENLNLSQERLLRITETVNKATIISGATSREASQGLIQLGQAIASNRLGGDEFRSISEQLPEITRIIADSLGVTRGELRKLSQDGALTADVIIRAFEEAQERVDEDFSKINKTIDQARTQLGTAFDIKVSENIDTISKPIIAFIDLIRNNIDTVVNAILSIGTAFAAVAVQALFLNKAIAGFVTGGIATFFTALTSPIGLVITAVGALTFAFLQFENRFKSLGFTAEEELEKLQKTFDLVKSVDEISGEVSFGFDPSKIQTELNAIDDDIQISAKINLDQESIKRLELFDPEIKKKLSEVNISAKDLANTISPTEAVFDRVFGEGTLVIERLSEEISLATRRAAEFALEVSRISTEIKKTPEFKQQARELFGVQRPDNLDFDSAVPDFLDIRQVLVNAASDAGNAIALRFNSKKIDEFAAALARAKIASDQLEESQTALQSVLGNVNKSFEDFKADLAIRSLESFEKKLEKIRTDTEILKAKADGDVTLEIGLEFEEDFREIEKETDEKLRQFLSQFDSSISILLDPEVDIEKAKESLRDLQEILSNSNGQKLVQELEIKGAKAGLKDANALSENLNSIVTEINKINAQDLTFEGIDDVKMAAEKSAESVSGLVVNLFDYVESLKEQAIQAELNRRSQEELTKEIEKQRQAYEEYLITLGKVNVLTQELRSLPAGTQFNTDELTEFLAILETQPDINKELASSLAKEKVEREEILELAKATLTLDEKTAETIKSITEDFDNFVIDAEIEFETNLAAIRAEIDGGDIGRDAFEIISAAQNKAAEATKSYAEEIKKLQDEIIKLSEDGDTSASNDILSRMKQIEELEISRVEINKKLNEVIERAPDQAKELNDLRAILDPQNKQNEVLEENLKLRMQINEEIRNLRSENDQLLEAFGSGSFNLEEAEVYLDVLKAFPELQKQEQEELAKTLVALRERNDLIKETFDLESRIPQLIEEIRNDFFDETFEIELQIKLDQDSLRAELAGGERAVRRFAREQQIIQPFLRARQQSDLEIREINNQISRLREGGVSDDSDLIKERQKAIESIEENIDALDEETRVRLREVKAIVATDIALERSIQLREGFADAFDSLIDALLEGEDAAKAFGDSIKNIFKDFTRQLFRDLFDDVFGEVTGQLSSSVTSIFRGLFDKDLRTDEKGNFLSIGDFQKQEAKKVTESFGSFFKELGIEESISKTLGDVAGNASLAFAGGSIGNEIGKTFNNLFGIKKGSTASNTISGLATGAGAGFAVGGPIGALVGGIIGGLTGLFKGLFGRKDATGRIDLQTGATSNLLSSKVDERNSERDELLSGIQQLASALIQATGGTLRPGTSLGVTVGKKSVNTQVFDAAGRQLVKTQDASKDDPNKIISNALSAILSTAVSGANELLLTFAKQALAAGAPVEALIQDVANLNDVLSQFDEPVSDFRKALETVEGTFQKVIDQTKAFGKSTVELERTLAELKQKIVDEFAKDLRTSILQIESPFAAAFTELAKIQEERAKDVEASGSALIESLANQLNLSEVEEFVRNATQGVNSIAVQYDPSLQNQTVDQINELNKAILEIQVASEGASEQFIALAETITGKLNQALVQTRQAFERSISDQLFDLENSQGSALRQIFLDQDQTIEIAQALGAEIEDILKITEVRVSQLIESAAQDPESLIQLAEAFNRLLGEIDSMGGSVDAAIEAFRRAQTKIVDAFNKDVTTRILNITQPTLQSFKALLEQQKSELEIAQQIGADLIILSQAQALERKQFFDNLSDEELRELGDFLDMIEDALGRQAVLFQRLNDNLSKQLEGIDDLASAAEDAASAFDDAAKTLRDTIDSIEEQYGLGNPAERLANLRVRFQSTLEAARLGDIDALNRLPELGDKIIDQSRDIFGGTRPFGEDLRFVLGALKEAEQIAIENAAKERERLEAIIEQRDLLREIRDLLSQEGATASDLTELLNRLDPLNTVIFRDLTDLIELLRNDEADLEGVRNFVQTQDGANSAIDQLYAAAGLIRPVEQDRDIQTISPDSFTPSQQSSQTNSDSLSSELIIASNEALVDKVDELIRTIRLQSNTNEDIETEARRTRQLQEKDVNENQAQIINLLRQIAGA